MEDTSTPPNVCQQGRRSRAEALHSGSAPPGNTESLEIRSGAAAASSACSSCSLKINTLSADRRVSGTSEMPQLKFVDTGN